jgi:hypothetical protein
MPAILSREWGRLGKAFSSHKSVGVRAFSTRGGEPGPWDAHRLQMSIEKLMASGRKQHPKLASPELRLVARKLPRLARAAQTKFLPVTTSR